MSETNKIELLEASFDNLQEALATCKEDLQGFVHRSLTKVQGDTDSVTARIGELLKPRFETLKKYTTKRQHFLIYPEAEFKASQIAPFYDVELALTWILFFYVRLSLPEQVRDPGEPTEQIYALSWDEFAEGFRRDHAKSVARQVLGPIDDVLSQLRNRGLSIRTDKTPSESALEAFREQKRLWPGDLDAE